MASLRYLLPVLAAAGHAAAQCSASTTTIGSAADATGLASCQTFTGDIVIPTSASGQLNIPGVQKIDGSLIANNVTQLTQLSGDSLETITKGFDLTDMTILSSLNFPRLSEVDSIKWTGLPGIQQLSFTSGVQMASSVDIENTQLNSLEGLNLEVVKTMIIVNNPELNDISMQLGNVSDALTVSDNGQKVNLQLPNLVWANNITVGNASQYSAPSLLAVNKSMGFRGCHFSTLSQANLTMIGGDLTILVNDQLSNISFPQLTTLGGGLSIGDNPKLLKVEGFPALQMIQGGVDIHGNFSSASLPALKRAQGALNVQSSDPNLDCTQFNNYATNHQVIRGKETCVPGVKNPSSNPNGVTGSSGGSSSSAASAVYVTGATGVLCVFAAIFGML